MNGHKMDAYHVWFISDQILVITARTYGTFNPYETNISGTFWDIACVKTAQLESSGGKDPVKTKIKMLL